MFDYRRILRISLFGFIITLRRFTAWVIRACMTRLAGGVAFLFVQVTRSAVGTSYTSFNALFGFDYVAVLTVAYVIVRNQKRFKAEDEAKRMAKKALTV